MWLEHQTSELADFLLGTAALCNTAATRLQLPEARQRSDELNGARTKRESLVRQTGEGLKAESATSSQSPESLEWG